jgi:hypothetical protein
MVERMMASASLSKEKAFVAFSTQQCGWLVVHYGCPIVGSDLP